jgi:hypothetical protein
MKELLGDFRPVAAIVSQNIAWWKGLNGRNRTIDAASRATAEFRGLN